MNRSQAMIAALQEQQPKTEEVGSIANLGRVPYGPASKGPGKVRKRGKRGAASGY